jgi:hypothetical protein
MTTKHTPGPWKVQTEISGRGYVVEMVGVNSDGDPKFNAMVEAPEYFVCGVGGTGKAECLANAMLVASAPELLEALKTCMHAVDLALCGTPSAHYFNELKARLGSTGYTLEDNLKLNMADIKGACTKAHNQARAAIAKATGE